MNRLLLSCSAQVCNSAKVSDHHAVVPTVGAARADLSSLPLGEQEVLRLVSLALLRAVCPPHRYAETAVTVECGGHSFSVKGKVTLEPGWRAYAEPTMDAALPDVAEGAALPVIAVRVKEGQTTPPKHFTEDSILASMEAAGAEDMPEDAERKGIGTPATRAGILEKLVSTGLVERKKAQKVTSLIPTQAGDTLICKYFRDAVLPADPALRTEIMAERPPKSCRICGVPIFSLSNAAKYCTDCAVRERRRRDRERKAKPPPHFRK